MALRGIQEYIARDVTILPESKTRVILLALRAIYSCIPQKEPSNIIIIIHIGLCVSSYNLMIVGDCRLAILSSHASESLWDVSTVTKVGGA